MSLLLFITPFIMACSTGETEKVAVEEKIEESDPVEEELTEEEQLIQELPEGVSQEDWNLILVNPMKALPEDFDIELAEVDNEQRIDGRIVDAWTSWKDAALAEGHRLFFASGYRDVERQRTNFNRSIQQYMDEGMTEAKAIEKSKEYLTEPGHSEHHTGLALDIVDEEWIVSGRGLEPEYENEESQKWLVSTMSDYGFILRYPEGKEDITAIQYEPWHFRYVGVEHAKFMEANDLTLEEYHELLTKVGK